MDQITSVMLFPIAFRCEKNPLKVGAAFLRHESKFYLYALYNKNKPKSDSLMSEYGTSFFKVNLFVAIYYVYVLRKSTCGQTLDLSGDKYSGRSDRISFHTLMSV